MCPSQPYTPEHLRFSRRTAIQAGTLGLLNLGMNHLDGLRAMAVPSDPARRESKSAGRHLYLSVRRARPAR